MKDNPEVKVTGESSQPMEGWHKEDIKAAIRKRGLTMTDLSIQYGLNPNSVRNALSRPLVCGERVIAAFLNVQLHELWPERWTQNGLRIRPRYADKYNALGRIPK